MISAGNLLKKPVPVLLVLLLTCAGCNDDDSNPVITSTPDNIPDSSLPWPGTPAQLMANFQTIYENRDADEYRLMLDPAFVTILQQGTRNEFPHVGQELDVTEENRIHERLFSGEAQTDPDGNLVPAVLDFEFSQFSQIFDWEESLPSDPIPNTLSSMYRVDIKVDRGQQFPSLNVVGQIRFYVTTAAGRLDGQPRTYYRLVGQLDLTGDGKGFQEVSWGSLKALFY
jgi:hypothetical protein